MTKVTAKMCCIALLCVYPLLTRAQEHSLPTQKSLESAVELADVALKNYQKTLGLLKDEPVVAATSHTDAEPIFTGEMAVILLRAKASHDATVDLLELVTLLTNVDGAATNAGLTAAAVALKIPTVNSKDADKFVRSSGALIFNVKQLREASDALWKVVEPCLDSQLPVRLKK